MLGPNDIRDSLAGAWALMLGRAEGLARLDLSIVGFWRSFAAIILVAPFSLLSLLSQQKLSAEVEEAPPAPAGFDVGPEMLTLVVDWLAFPIIFALVAQPLGLGARYVPFIVARNWAAVILVAGVSLVHAVHLIGIVPSQLATVLLLAALAVTLRFAYLLARTTLVVGVAVALPIVILDFLVSLLVWSLAARFF
jgi:hypothetical protein